ncbi:hypothetical protein PTTG_28479 [Puccinia triticina 1-1 BBBD Race 1]|uniref:Helicase ATP-binding domain-containing protein n=1 Tax=Puccinia triticina (isolate 1-1 / race 1 (BBBD)) TaxID=630390 RepID=A0A180GDD3_PUCT1|nr:hypothetical protein PTTG_28479 [Puccinia triticina 1-1 BBBD Race 1]
MTNIECLGMVSGNCVMVDGLQHLIKYTSRTRALLQKGNKTINVFTWPGTQAGYVTQPLSDVLRKLIIGPVGTVSTELHSFLNQNTDNQKPAEILYPIVMLDSTLVASPTPTPTLTVVIMLFSQCNCSANILQIFEYCNLTVEMVKGYCAVNFGGIPHSLRLNDGQNPTSKPTIHGCKTPLLLHQLEALDFILQLESPESTVLSKFWNSSTCKWLKKSFNHFVNIGKSMGPINHLAQGSILVDNMGLGKNLTSLALIVISKNAAEAFSNTTKQLAKAKLVICPLLTLSNWEAKIHKHLYLNLIKYVVYHGEAQKTLTAQILWSHDIVLVTYNTVSTHYESNCNALFEGTWFWTILDEAQVGVAPAEERIGFEQLNGLCSVNQREKSLVMIRQDPKIRVLLATIAAGGVGIDLTCTQNVYLMVSMSECLESN